MAVPVETLLATLKASNEKLKDATYTVLPGYGAAVAWSHVIVVVHDTSNKTAAASPQTMQIGGQTITGENSVADLLAALKV